MLLTKPNWLNLIFVDKIIVNNGVTVGEYVIDNQPLSTNTNEEDGRLHSLPNTGATEYIMNWFEQQQSIISSTPTESFAKQFCSTTSLESAESSPGESDGDRTNKRYDSRYITFRKVCIIFNCFFIIRSHFNILSGLS